MKKNIITSVFRYFDLSINRISSLNKEKSYLKYIINAYEELIKYRSIRVIRDVKTIEGIVFSKNRALQLDLLLSSYFYYGNNLATLYVLYKTESLRQRNSYEQLIERYKDKKVFFIEEEDFRNQLLHILANIESMNIFFLTDDAVFIRNFDIALFNLYDCEKFVFCLTKGSNLHFSFPTNKTEELPEFIIDENNSNLRKWNFSNYTPSSMWNYPLSLDGVCYDRIEILILIENISFKNPNSLEGSLQVYRNIFKYRLGICYEKVVLVNVHCNKVQNENDNLTSGYHSVDELLMQWENGKSIEFKKFEEMDIYSIQTKPFNFINRNNF